MIEANKDRKEKINERNENVQEINMHDQMPNLKF